MVKALSMQEPPWLEGLEISLKSYTKFIAFVIDSSSRRFLSGSKKFRLKSPRIWLLLPETRVNTSWIVSLNWIKFVQEGDLYTPITQTDLRPIESLQAASSQVDSIAKFCTAIRGDASIPISSFTYMATHPPFLTFLQKVLAWWKFGIVKFSASCFFNPCSDMIGVSGSLSWRHASRMFLLALIPCAFRWKTFSLHWVLS